MATIKGDVRLGDYTLRLDFNALCDAEEDFPGIMRGELDIGSPRKIRSLIRHALTANHPGLTDREVGDIIQEAGLENVGPAIEAAMAASFPAAEGGASTANPPKAPAKAGTGKKP